MTAPRILPPSQAVRLLDDIPLPARGTVVVSRSAALLAEALRRELAAERNARFWRRTAFLFAFAWAAGIALSAGGGA